MKQHLDMQRSSAAYSPAWSPEYLTHLSLSGLKVSPRSSLAALLLNISTPVSLRLDAGGAQVEIDLRHGSMHSGIWCLNAVQCAYRATCCRRCLVDGSGCISTQIGGAEGADIVRTVKE